MGWSQVSKRRRDESRLPDCALHTLRDIRVDGKRIAPAAFPHDAQAIDPGVLVQLVDGAFRRRVQQSSGVHLGKRQRRSGISSAVIIAKWHWES